MSEPCNHKCAFALFCPECVATLRAELEAAHKSDGLNIDRIRELSAELAQCRGELVDAEDKAVADVLLIRCIKHISVPQQNSTEFSGGECGACIAAERDTLKQSHAKLLEDYENANAEADTLKGEVEKERALPAQLLDVHAICDQRDKAVQDRDSHRLLLDELAGELELISLSAIQSNQPQCAERIDKLLKRRDALTKYQQQCGEKI